MKITTPNLRQQISSQNKTHMLNPPYLLWEKSYNLTILFGKTHSDFLSNKVGMNLNLLKGLGFIWINFCGLLKLLLFTSYINEKTNKLYLDTHSRELSSGP